MKNLLYFIASFFLGIAFCYLLLLTPSLEEKPEILEDAKKAYLSASSAAESYHAYLVWSDLAGKEIESAPDFENLEEIYKLSPKSDHIHDMYLDRIMTFARIDMLTYSQMKVIPR